MNKNKKKKIIIRYARKIYFERAYYLDEWIYTSPVCHYYTGYGLWLKQITILLDIAFSRDNNVIILLVHVHRHLFMCTLVCLRSYIRG